MKPGILLVLVSVSAWAGQPGRRTVIMPMRDAVAISAATVLCPAAGAFDRAAYATFRAHVWIEEI